MLQIYLGWKRWTNEGPVLPWSGGWEEWDFEETVAMELIGEMIAEENRRSESIKEGMKR